MRSSSRNVKHCKAQAYNGVADVTVETALACNKTQAISLAIEAHMLGITSREAVFLATTASPRTVEAVS